jgi:hypothetical protein
MAKRTKKTKAPAGGKTAAAKPAAANAKKAAAADAPAPTAAAISARAHQIWINRGKPVPGTPLEDWCQAERELGSRKT